MVKNNILFQINSITITLSDSIFQNCKEDTRLQKLTENNKIGSYSIQ